MTPVQPPIFNSTLFFCSRAKNCMVNRYSLFWCGILSWRSCHFGNSETHLKNLLSSTPQPPQQTCYYIKERYLYDNAFPWWCGITEDIVTVKKQAAVKAASTLTTLCGSVFTTLKTIQVMPRCGIDSFFHAPQPTLPYASPKGPILLLVTDSIIHNIEWD